MLDFLIVSRKKKKDTIVISPKFVINSRISDLMIRGNDFYAVWDERTGLWSTVEDTASELIDAELTKAKNDVLSNSFYDEENVIVNYMWDSDSGSLDRWHKYCTKQLRDRYHQLDEKIIFSDTKVKKTDYVSKRLDYPLGGCECKSYDKLMRVLYDDDERRKLEWAIGAIISGDSKHIQKFVVLYGSAGSGKSTVLNIIQMLFPGYYNVFDAKELGSANSEFALESFKDNPLISIQHDGDLSRIEDNTKINSVVSHETMLINEKHKNKYSAKFNSFLFMGTNKPVRITDGKSGIIRRLIDVRPSGRKIPYQQYRDLMSHISFELSGIAKHCLDLYLQLGENYYDTYVARDMISATNDFYDFVEYNYDDFKKDDKVTLNEAWKRYKNYCDFAGVQYPFPMRAVRVELKNYFRNYEERATHDGTRYRNLYSGFMFEKFDSAAAALMNRAVHNASSWLILAAGIKSAFDILAADYPAQYTTEDGLPAKKWDKVITKLSSLDTSRLHYVRVPENHIVIDFDIKGPDGQKSLELNMAAASKFPPTYAELSKSGQGIHLHYIYSGDVSKLSRVYDDYIEIKVFTGKSSLRRKLTQCNDIPIATINSGLPLKEETKMQNWEGVKNEKMLRYMILKDLNKEYFGATKPSVDHINKILQDSYERGILYDVTDLRPRVLKFAAGSTNNSQYCVKLVASMPFCSEVETAEAEDNDVPDESGDNRKAFYDVEVLPNLFIINWKYEYAETCNRMINPSSAEVEEWIKTIPNKIGYNCRRYDNHICYARMMGYDNEQLFKLSQKIINGESQNAMFREAYDLSYADVYDFCSVKQSLKKWEIELGIHHKELGLPWDQPVPEELWTTVAEYCDNDVMATEAVFHARQQDFIAREILADLSGLTVNDTTRMHTTKIIFGNNKNPVLNYPDISETFPGYEFVRGEDGKMHNMYKGIDASFGGYVFADEGAYTNVALLDVASLHPNSIIQLNLFGDYTQNFKDILDARIAIKHHDFDTAKNLLDGKLTKYLTTPEAADQLAQALKIVINSVYGFTAASFDNPFKDNRNVNNIVALRGALFMISLMEEVKARGYKVAHIKTDSIKIPNATPEIIKFCVEYGKKYGYTFEHEATYAKMCLVNQAVYIARYAESKWCEDYYQYVPEKNAKHGGEWTATGAQFQVPYVFKTLFSKEPYVFKDFCETKSVTKGNLYLDMNERLGPEEHDYHFVGRVGEFCPVKPDFGGGVLYREDKGKYYAATGTKGYRWLESEVVKTLYPDDKWKDIIDKRYYMSLCTAAADEVSKYADFDWFCSDDPVLPGFMNLPENSEDGVPFN